jgi:hypothetical protein
VPAERGVIYVATGERCNAEVFQSVRSLRVHHPGVPVTLFTDLNVRDDDFDEVRVINEPRHNWADKIPPLLDSPYTRTIFLDTDTYICGSLDPVFRLLDRFELAVAHDTIRFDVRLSPDIPPTFPELNTGVVAYRLTDGVRSLFDAWLPDFDDQPSFRQLLWAADVTFGVLPPEFNLGISCPNAIGTRGHVTVLHSHADDLDRVARLVNRSQEARAVLPTIGHFDPSSAAILSHRGNQLLRVTGRIRAIFRRAS